MDGNFKKNNSIIDSIAIGCQISHTSKKEIIAELNELTLLSQTAGYKIKKIFIQKRYKYDPATFIGRGKIEEILSFAKINDIKIIIFNDDLNPNQIKNIQNHIGKNIQVIDRSALIIEIFSKNAKTKESKVQVQIAKLEYLLPRLTRLWTHLERQMGGRGTRGGPGETQIEVDRRLISSQLVKLKEKLKKIENQRIVQSKKRQQTYNICICGYTNAGKSTLMKILTGSNIFVKDQLFATLDATSRKMHLKNNRNVTITDTVGFINKLPHNLIASFRSTLSVVKDADLIIKVLDASSNNLDIHIKVIDETLNYLDAKNKNKLIVFNKIDLVTDKNILNNLIITNPDAIFVSARKQLKINTLINSIEKFSNKDYCEDVIKLNYEDTKLLNYIYKNIEVTKQINNNNKMILNIKGLKKDIDKIKSKIDY